jgi:hypothetical protein
MKRSSLSRVGAVSHVSCIDRRLISGPGGAAAGMPCRQLMDFGLARLENLCTLFGAQPVRVMARCGEATSEVFLELAGNLQIQYFGALGASHDEQSLWVEGPRGSLRAEGAVLWWRKRGWPKFLPWGLQLRSHLNAGEAQNSALRDAILRSSELGKVVELAR